MPEIVRKRPGLPRPFEGAPGERESIPSWVVVYIFWPTIALLFLVLGFFAVAMRVTDRLAGRSARIAKGGVGAPPAQRR